MIKPSKSFKTGKVISNIKDEVDQWAGNKQSYLVPAAESHLKMLKTTHVREEVKLSFQDNQKTVIGLSRESYNKLLVKYKDAQGILRYYAKKYKLKFNDPDPIYNQEKEETSEDNN